MRSPWSGASSFGAAPNHQAKHATPPDRHERPRPQASAAGHWRSRPDPSGSCGPRERTNTCVSPPSVGQYRVHCDSGAQDPTSPADQRMPSLGGSVILGPGRTCIGLTNERSGPRARHLVVRPRCRRCLPSGDAAMHGRRAPRRGGQVRPRSGSEALDESDSHEIVDGPPESLKKCAQNLGIRGPRTSKLGGEGV